MEFGFEPRHAEFRTWNTQFSSLARQLIFRFFKMHMNTKLMQILFSVCLRTQKLNHLGVYLTFLHFRMLTHSRAGSSVPTNSVPPPPKISHSQTFKILIANTPFTVSSPQTLCFKNGTSHGFWQPLFVPYL